MDKNGESLDALFVKVMKMHYARAYTLFNKIGLYRGQPPVLFLLWKKDGRTQKELSDNLFVTPATMTMILKRLEKAGFIEKKADYEDMRRSIVFLTDKGKEIRKDVERTLQILEEECFAGFSMEEKILLRRFFLQMKENLQQHGELR